MLNLLIGRTSDKTTAVGRECDTFYGALVSLKAVKEPLSHHVQNAHDSLLRTSSNETAVGREARELYGDPLVLNATKLVIGYYWRAISKKKIIDATSAKDSQSLLWDSDSFMFHRRNEQSFELDTSSVPSFERSTE